MTPETYHHAITLWNYHNLPEPTLPSDFLLVMGSADDRVAVHAANLYGMGFAKIVCTSGGYGKVTKNTLTITEGERFARIMQEHGVPAENILIENKASNSGENILFVKELLQHKGLFFKTGILVTKPYMKRRAFATAMKQWPGIEWQVSAPPLGFDEYITGEISSDLTINLMVGDLQRIKTYPQQGFQVEQEIPAEVWASYEYLRDHGFDRYVLPS